MADQAANKTPNNLKLQAIKIDADQIANLGVSLSQKVKEATDIIDDMASDVEGLAETWEGDNHDRFVAYFDERFTRVDEYGVWLEGFVNAVVRAAGLYKNLPDEVRQSMGKALGSLASSVSTSGR